MSSESKNAVRFEQEAVCEMCGRFGAYLFEGKTLCAECYEASGSCCPEFTRESSSSDRSGSAERRGS